MNTLLISLVIIIGIVGLIATLLIIKQESEKLKKYEEEGDTAENELKRSHEYETQSMSNVKLLSWIYIVVIGASLVIFAIYVF